MIKREQPNINMNYDQLEVTVFSDFVSLGAAAATHVAKILNETVAARGTASIILATGNSQLSFLKAIGTDETIAWNKISVFHMDEYLGMSDTHPASFRKYMYDNLISHVHPREFYGLKGDAPNVGVEIARYTQLLAQQQPVLCVMGIGENGHLAFNDPPADFETTATLHVVNLDEACRRQQVGEGHFAALAAVPTQALSLTISALIRPPHVLVIAPETRKAAAIKAALTGPITPDCPASILRTCAHAQLYLDRDSASLL